MFNMFVYAICRGCYRAYAVDISPSFITSRYATFINTTPTEYIIHIMNIEYARATASAARRRCALPLQRAACFTRYPYTMRIRARYMLLYEYDMRKKERARLSMTLNIALLMIRLRRYAISPLPMLAATTLRHA